MFFKIFDASKPDSFSGTLGGIGSQISMPCRRKIPFFPPRHLHLWRTAWSLPQLDSQEHKIRETHRELCSNSYLMAISAHQTFQIQGDVENSEDSDSTALQGPRHGVLIQQCASSQVSEGATIYKRKMFSLLLHLLQRKFSSLAT